MTSKIIALSGGTGVGTSTFALKLATLLQIPTIVSTDMVRETIRSTINPAINPALEKSTYTAGITINYGSKPEDIQRAEIIRGFKNQCDAVSSALEAICVRAQLENIPLIIEGVHLRPGLLAQRSRTAVDEYHIHISDPLQHEKRFSYRKEVAPTRGQEKYLRHFSEIRWICDYLCDRAQKHDIPLVDNTSSIEVGVDTLFGMIKR